ncbi:MAG: ribosome biogenesis GTPase Der [Alphaproteobacteria bacterium]|nr:ribosome biogenesis GTPase Der [Alphaproteobacteria bacterium]
MSSIAIIGRPNVGKSTLFNRLIGKKLALVHDLPGVTRDRRYAKGRLSDLAFNLIDTAGLDNPKSDELTKKMWEQTQYAIAEADILICVVDARAGITSLDRYYADLIRKANKPVILLANKCEGSSKLHVLGDANNLGLGEAIPFSAAHGEGLVELFEALKLYIKPQEKTCIKDDSEKHLQLAIVGRPNVGKSTLINSLIQEERLLTADQPGVTRDSIAIDWEYKGRLMRLIDTAGMRKRSNVTSKLEEMAVHDALRAVDFAQIVLLVLDHETPLAKQDVTIANKVIDEGRVLMIAINKWDLIKNQKTYLEDIKHKLSHILPQIKGIPCIPISALKGKNLEKLLDSIFEMYDLWNKRISTGQLNRWLQHVTQYHPPPLAGHSRIKIKYLTQVKTRPPTFTMFASKPEELPDTYIRYLQNALREDFKLPGIPIRIQVKSGKNPYVKQ